MPKTPAMPDDVQRWLYKNITAARHEGDIKVCRRLAEIAQHYLKINKLIDDETLLIFISEINGAINFKKHGIKMQLQSGS